MSVYDIGLALASISFLGLLIFMYLVGIPPR